MKKILRKLKGSKRVFRLYFFVMQSLLKFLAIFVRTDEKLILFVSFSGRKYDDSPKEIYEAMLEDERFKAYKLVWAFKEPANFRNEVKNAVKIDSIRFYLLSLKAKIWVNNSMFAKVFVYKKKNTLHFNTWHGTAIKHIGIDTKDSLITALKGKLKWDIDIMSSQGKHDDEIFFRAFGDLFTTKDKNRLVPTGLPRNDVLSNYTSEKREKLRVALDLPKDKKIILYAPTWRTYGKDGVDPHILKPPLEIGRLEKELGDEYVLLVRVHHYISQIYNVDGSKQFVRNFSNYKYLNDLMIVSDLLITDYSSICFDYAIMDKPILYFAYDYEEYKKNTGVYVDIAKECSESIVYTENQLVDKLKGLDYAEAVTYTKRFREKYVEYYGNGVERCIDEIIRSV